MGKKKEHHEEHVDETWLIPYSDMLTLLLALFIVMFAMSQVDKQKLERASEQFSQIFSGGTGLLQQSSVTIVPHKSTQPPKTTTPVSNTDPMAVLQKSLNDKIKENGYKDQVDLGLNQEGLEITIQDVALFDSGKATVLDNVKPMLLQICDMLRPVDNQIRIAGHTDNIPIRTREFRSNWDLSAMRAINVMTFMLENGNMQPQRMSIQAYGEYQPKFDNATPEGRAGNRRIEIHVIRNSQQAITPVAGDSIQPAKAESTLAPADAATTGNGSTEGTTPASTEKPTGQ